MLDVTGFNKTIAGNKLKTLTINTTDTNLVKFWGFVRSVITSRKDTAVVLKPKLSEKVGGETVNYKNLNFIVMRPSIYDEDTNSLFFETPKEAAMFIHEIAHYLHFSYFNGKYSAETPLKGKCSSMKASNLVNTYYDEIEAWHLSNKFARTWLLAPELIEAINLVNARNMLCVCANNNISWKDGTHISDEDIKNCVGYVIEDFIPLEQRHLTITSKGVPEEVRPVIRVKPRQPKKQNVISKIFGWFRKTFLGG